MNRKLKVTLLFSPMLLACPELDPGGGGGIPDGGTGIDFSKGWVYVRKDDLRKVYIADSRDVSRTAPLSSHADARHPSLSADGRKVVYVRSVGSDTELWVISSSGGTPTRILSSDAAKRNLRTPVFSPDGKKIAFAYDEGAGSSIGVVNDDGSGFQRLAGGGALSYGSPSFYADGTAVLAAAGSSASGFNQIHKVPLSGSPQPITNDLGNEAMVIVNRVVLSPSGTRAAFDGRLSSNAVRIFVVDLTSKQVHRVTDYPGDPNAQDGFPAWVGPDSVGFSSNTGNADQVYVLPASAQKTSGGLTLLGAVEPWFGPN